MKSIHHYIGALLLGTVCVALPSCTDTWGDHYDDGPDGSMAATENLWQQISSNPKLSRFAALAAATTYYKDQQHPLKKDDGTPFTFKDMLSGTQLFTVWAPENEALADYEKWEALTETDPYLVQQQVLANSMSLFRNVATGTEVDTITMLNGKKMTFDRGEQTMQAIKIAEANIPATNGTLHEMATRIPFEFNIYEYIKNSGEARITRLHDIVVAEDTVAFNEEGSIEGAPDADGNPTYVDSMYLTTNMMCFNRKYYPNNNNTDRYLSQKEAFGEHIEFEDSSYIFIMPTDAAWQATYNKLEKLYNYAPIYLDKVKGNNNVKNQYREVPNVDSLKVANINMDIVAPLCFNLMKQPDAGKSLRRWTMTDFLANSNAASYILNTFGDTLRTDENWQQSQLFGGEQVKMSNGMGLITNEWPIPLKLYKPNVDIEMSFGAPYNKSNAKGNYEMVSYNYALGDSALKSKGRVSFDNFAYITSETEASKATFEFKITSNTGENRESDIMSGKYDVYAVMVPNFFRMSKDSIYMNPNDLKNSGFAVVDGDTIPLRHKLEAYINYCDGSAKGSDAKSKKFTLEYDGEKVDTILLTSDFEFPYSYKNLSHSYPTIQINSTSSSSERKKGYSNDFCIDRIIFVSKED